MLDEEVMEKVQGANTIRNPMETIIEMGYELIRRSEKIKDLERQMEELQDAKQIGV